MKVDVRWRVDARSDMMRASKSPILFAHRRAERENAPSESVRRCGVALRAKMVRIA